MSILISKNTKVLIQGITGKEGQKAVKAMSDYHTQVVCGVTPNKGGQEVEGRPVFNSVKEAIKYIEDSSASPQNDIKKCFSTVSTGNLIG